MAMAETVNIPSLPHGATWRRSSETTAGRRKSPLKGVGVEEGIKERMALLEEVGVFLAEYGENQFILREHPIWMAEEEIESGIYEMCDMLLLTKEVSIKKYRAELAIMMSCKRSIKANHRIDDHSARQLLYQLSQCDNPYNCPHGRPVLVHFTKSDMEKMFRRIQENHTSLRELGKY